MIDRYTIRDTRFSRFLDETIRFLETVTKEGVICDITEAEVSELFESCGRDFNMRKKIPVVIVDIIFTIVEDIPLIECERKNRSGEASVCSDLVTILIEYDVLHRFSITEHSEHVSLMFEKESAISCQVSECFTNIDNFFITSAIASRRKSSE